MPAISCSLSPRSVAQRRRDAASRSRCSCAALRQLQRDFSIGDERLGREAAVHDERAAPDSAGRLTCGHDEPSPLKLSHRKERHAPSPQNVRRPHGDRSHPAWLRGRTHVIRHCTCELALHERTEPRSRGPRLPQPDLGRPHRAMQVPSRGRASGGALVSVRRLVRDHRSTLTFTCAPSGR